MAAPLAHIPSHDAWGSHGWQRRKAGAKPVSFRPKPTERRRLDAAEAEISGVRALGARVERKAGSLAVHWRGLDALSTEVVRERVREAWGPFERGGLECLEFDGGVELRARSRTKGSAVAHALGESSPRAVCAYLGDDRTDEDAFEAVRPRGIGVLVRPALRPTRADLWLEPPRELVEFLRRWRAAPP
jgi:trehalose-phosphatase